MVSILWSATSTFSLGPQAPSTTITYTTTIGTLPPGLAGGQGMTLIVAIVSSYAGCPAISDGRNFQTHLVLPDTTDVSLTAVTNSYGLPGLSGFGSDKSTGTFSGYALTDARLVQGGTITLAETLITGGGPTGTHHVDSVGAIMFVLGSTTTPSFVYDGQYGPHGSVGNGVPLYDTGQSAHDNAVFACGGAGAHDPMTDPTPDVLLGFQGRNSTSTGMSVSAAGWTTIETVSVPDAFSAQSYHQGPVSLGVALFDPSAGLFDLAATWDIGDNSQTWDAGVNYTLVGLTPPLLSRSFAQIIGF